MYEFILHAAGLIGAAWHGLGSGYARVRMMGAIVRLEGVFPALATVMLLGVAIGPVWALDIAIPDETPPSAGQTGPVQTGEPAASPRIGEIRIGSRNVFDPDNPKDNKSIFRFANFLHVKTREDVIRDQLLFQPGDEYDPQKLEESERILRNKPYIYDSTITATENADGSMDVEIETQDVWTLNPSFSFGRRGGKNTSSVGISELNLLGTGIEVEASRYTGIDRDSTRLSFYDANLGSSWVRLGAQYSNNSDGYSRSIVLDRPFYSLDSRWSAGVELLDEERVDSLYDRGEIANEFNHGLSEFRAYGGRSSGLNDGWVQRWKVGAVFRDDNFSPVAGSPMSSVVPEDRRFAYPFVAYELVEDEFYKTRNHDQIGRTEDFYLGTRFSTELGWAPTAFGSDRNALMFAGAARHGWRPSKTTTWLLSAGLGGRLEGGSAENTTLSAGLRYYRKQSEKRLLFASLSADTTWNPDVDNPLMVGGDLGLRGYPLRYQSGSKRAVLSIEQRYFTDWYPFRLFHVGGAVFFDAGRTWGTSGFGDSDLGLLKDVGLGLRFAGSRSGQGRVIHVDLAFPLDGDPSIKSTQFIVETKTSF